MSTGQDYEKRTIRRMVSFTPSEWAIVCEYTGRHGRFGFSFLVYQAIREFLSARGIDITAKK